MFYADLHVHSKHSRATSQDCDLEHLYYWARKKGIGVVGTGDFTHPAWMAELREKLVPAEPGLFRLREDLERAMEERLQTAPLGPTRFMLSVEISNIYKRADKTRKIHNLIYAPDLESAARFSAKLGRIGNIASDGRPILGLDSRDLLEIALESGEGCYLVPAHIWTPWFAVLGSKSGFDAVDDCFADLAHHVFAVETGLSSDPAMNWRLSSLDRYRLVSSSDAHSPAKLGREATLFDTELDYFALRRALETGQGFGGTVEFFPEEGKYHLDGHRKCNVCLLPQESRAHDGRCPACGKPLTLGVLHRIEELADRPDGSKPEGAAPFDCLVPLAEVLAETLDVGPASQKVQSAYERMLSKLGPELHILKAAPIEDVERRASPLIAEAIARMRAGKVQREAGYDGEYGVIRMFEPGELAGRARLSLFEDAGTAKPARAKREDVAPAAAVAVPPEPAPQLPQLDLLALAAARTPVATSLLDALDPEQRAAASIIDGPLLIIAGPGTGKTRTLTHRIAHLVRERGVAPNACLAITFTRRAAGEMRERLHGLLGEDAHAIHVATFHALGAAMLREHAQRVDLPADVRVASERERLDALTEGLQVSVRDATVLLEDISRTKRTRVAPAPGSELAQACTTYARHLKAAGLVDLDDLLAIPVGLLERDPDLAASYRARYRHVSIDEYQDVDELQYRLVRLLAARDSDAEGAAASLCAIGDPDQAIYSFRGADVAFFTGFQRDFPGARVVQLTRNYRSGATIVEASAQVIRPSSLVPERRLEAQRSERLKVAIHEAASDRAEADFIVRQIEAMIGGYSFEAVDSGRLDSGDGSGHVFSDFAVLYRTSRQLEPIESAFTRAGIPFQRRAHTRLLADPLVQAIAAALQGAAAAPGSVHARLVAAVHAQAGADAVRREAVLAMLAPLALRAGADCAAFLAELASGVEVDTWDPRADRVSVLTLHAAKGLEFDVVFVAGCEDGIVPLRFGDECDVAEERRLFFVGMTRARRRLVLSHTRKRLWQGALREGTPSPFLCDIEQHLLERSQTREQPARRAKTQLDLF